MQSLRKLSLSLPTSSTFSPLSPNVHSCELQDPSPIPVGIDRRKEGHSEEPPIFFPLLQVLLTSASRSFSPLPPHATMIYLTLKMFWRVSLTALLAIPSLYIFKGLHLPGSRHLRLPFPRSLYLWIRSRSRQNTIQSEARLFKARPQLVESGTKEEVVKLAVEERQKLIKQRERGFVSEERITGLKRALSTAPLRQLDPSEFTFLSLARFREEELRPSSFPSLCSHD